ncbi:MAG TPA: LysR family transcriptional regulator [Rubrobacteraceae bacterium]|nr:LysR family transcriptional regulator [Rubrobacteraceae bacterium]
MVELRHLRYFVAVAEELHFGRAAARLRVSQSPLSQQIIQLERELGVELLERTKRRVELTSAGEVYLREARRVLTYNERAEEAARRAGRGELGRLVLGFAGSAAYGVLPLLLKASRERLPDLGIELRGELLSSELVRALGEDEIQIAILLRTSTENPDLEVAVVRREPFVAALPADHPLARRRVVDPRELSEEPFVIFPRRRGAVLHDAVINTCQDAGFSPRVVQEATELPTQVSLIAAGMGVALVPASMRHLRYHGVVYRSLRGHPPAPDTAVAWRRGGETPTVRAFLQVVRAVADVADIPDGVPGVSDL